MSEETRVLAQYDFRTKQKYIFRTNKMREIVGASALITCMYDLFINTLDTQGIKVEKNYKFPAGEEKQDINTQGWSYKVIRFIDLRYENAVNTTFDPDFSGTDLGGKALYVGGGNLYILWKNKETALKANKILCQLLREEGYSLFPACGMAEFRDSYKKTIRELGAAFQRSKDEVPPFEPMAVLPFTRVDRKTSFPVAYYDGREYLPKECSLKRQVNDYRIRVTGNDPLNEKILDNLTEKGTDSLLAVIHIDGNNMGERVSKTMERVNENSYADCVKTIREFSNRIQADFVTNPLDKISKWLVGKQKKARIIVAGGDDVTLVCRAIDAYAIVKEYFKALKGSNEGKNEDDFNSACAGICIFHSHAPFADAYGIAEECCENAKKKNRKHGGKNMLMDFQYCFSGITGDLKNIRRADIALMGRPYSYSKAEGINQIDTLEKYVDKIKKIGDDSGSDRSAVKHLSSLLLMKKDSEYDLEIRRLNSSYPNADLPEDGKEKEEFKSYLFDIAQVYDLWFGEEKKV